MLKRNPKDKLNPIVIAAAALALVVVVIVCICWAQKESRAAADESADLSAVTKQEPIVKYLTEEKIIYVDKMVPVEVEKQISTAILREGLQNMGVLITQEYSFSEVTTVESSKVVLWFFTSESKVIMGYDGEVLAGVDFSQIAVSKNDNSMKIAVYLPEAEIVSCNIDLESFHLYLEDVSTWNKLSAEDYNGALVELEKRVTERAMEKKILEKANENAELVIRNFITSLVGDEYQISFYRK